MSTILGIAITFAFCEIVWLIMQAGHQIYLNNKLKKTRIEFYKQYAKYLKSTEEEDNI